MDEEDDYWGSSNVKKNRATVNVFDEKVVFEAASDLDKLRKNLKTPGEEEVECVNWDDTPVITRPSIQQKALQTSVKVSDSSLDPFRGPTVLPTAPERQKSSLNWSDEPSIDSIVKENDPRPPAPARKLTKHEEEINFLCSELEKAKKTVHSKLPVKETVTRMITGLPYSLEQYRSKEEKLELLDRAIETHDGNAIIAAVLFLKRTVTDKIFNAEFAIRPDAINQYLSYLRAHFQQTELENMLGLLNRSEEMAMVKYKQAASIVDAVAKTGKLKSCLDAHFKCDSQLEHDASMIQQQLDLLQIQRPIDSADEMEQTSRKPGIFMTHPRVVSIVNQSVLTTLYYCSFYHHQDPENTYASPLFIRKQHQLNDKQYQWSVIRAQARLKKWDEINSLLQVKGWFGGIKLKTSIGFDNVADILHKHFAPMKEILKFLMLMDDADKRPIKLRRTEEV
ncbi:hypothetical protein CHS0354_038090 [Potamilus streckersoni]|uniref:Vps16 C-terminal domain-containing protein n=1 Tax=Potamilus streckersoni TaxID=2493646 RepID=A0AAE0SSE6_9BIVA|nr:hypothetical protein CHS0354_038090 [Potamilus streckersoni]